MATRKKPVRRGRPPLPKGTARSVVFCLRLTAAELAAIEATAEHAGKPARLWAREKVLRGLKVIP